MPRGSDEAESGYPPTSQSIAGINKAFFEARTVPNRPVFGGESIAPDEQVGAETITSSRQALLDPTFLFTRQAVNGSVGGDDNFFMTKCDTSNKAMLPELKLASFLAFSSNARDTASQSKL